MHQGIKAAILIFGAAVFTVSGCCSPKRVPAHPVDSDPRLAYYATGWSQPYIYKGTTDGCFSEFGYSIRSSRLSSSELNLARYKKLEFVAKIPFGTRVEIQGAVVRTYLIGGPMLFYLVDISDFVIDSTDPVAVISRPQFNAIFNVAQDENDG